MSWPGPPITEALRFGTLVRAAAIANTDRRVMGGAGKPDALARLSGHDLAVTDPHVAYLPVDEDGDGLIDHVLLWLASGFGREAVLGLSHLRKVWDGPNREWEVDLKEAGDRDTFEDHQYLGESRAWVSVTPWLHPWFRKKGFGPREQLLRECRIRGLPQVELRSLESVPAANRRFMVGDFVRTRKGKDLRQPDRRGSLWAMEFAEPVSGPVHLGWGRWWGLGVFRKEGKFAR